MENKIKFEDVKTNVAVFKCHCCGNHFAYEEGIVAEIEVDGKTMHSDVCPHCKSEDFDLVK